MNDLNKFFFLKADISLAKVENTSRSDGTVIRSCESIVIREVDRSYLFICEMEKTNDRE